VHYKESALSKRMFIKAQNEIKPK